MQKLLLRIAAQSKMYTKWTIKKFGGTLLAKTTPPNCRIVQNVYKMDYKTSGKSIMYREWTIPQNCSEVGHVHWQRRGCFFYTFMHKTCKIA